MPAPLHVAKFPPRFSLFFCSLQSILCLLHRCCSASADGRDCLVLLIRQVSMPSCYLNMSVCVCVCVPGSSSCLIHAKHTQICVAALFIFRNFTPFLSKQCAVQMTLTLKPYLSVIALIYITLFTSSAAHRSCNFHNPFETALTFSAFVYTLDVTHMSRFNTVVLTQVIEHKGRMAIFITEAETVVWM